MQKRGRSLILYKRNKHSQLEPQRNGTPNRKWLIHRKGAAITNFETTLPKPQSDLAKYLLKDPYKFDFLSLGDEYAEKDLENALVEHITKFLLELGAGFSFVGKQYPWKWVARNAASTFCFTT